MRRFKQNEIDKLADILKNDGVISIPTDTLYGLCVRMNSKKAREKLMKIKNRPSNKSLPIMCEDEEQIKSIGIVNDKTEKIIKAFMPGPITLVLLKKDCLPKYVNEGSPEIGVRMATSDQVKELIKKVGGPICVSSANKSGEPTCKSIDEIEEIFPDLDGIMEGDVFFGKGSTIVDCTTDNIKIQREGPILLNQIMEVLK